MDNILYSDFARFALLLQASWYSSYFSTPLPLPYGSHSYYRYDGEW